MLSDFKLQRLRTEKKKQEQARFPAIEIALRLSGMKPTAKQLRESLAPFINTPESPEIVKAANTDPVRTSLEENGFV